MEQLEFDFEGQIHWDTYLNSLYMQIVNNPDIRANFFDKGRRFRDAVHTCLHLPKSFKIFINQHYVDFQYDEDETTIWRDLNLVLLFADDTRSPGAYRLIFPK